MLTDEEKIWLSRRAFIHREAGAVFTHGDVVAPSEWRYILNARSAKENFAAVGDRLIFCGHTHHVEVWQQTPLARILPQFESELSVPAVHPESVTFTAAEGHRYIVNVGSVGNPRNDLCSVYGIYEPEVKRVTLRRLPFDFADYLMQLTLHQVKPPGWLIKLAHYVLDS